MKKFESNIVKSKGNKSIFLMVFICIVLSITNVYSSSVSSSTNDASTLGNITGHVNDKITGDILPSVIITIVNTKFKSSSNFQGKYFILGIPVGIYTLRATSVGYKTVTVNNVQVSAGQNTHFDFELELAVGRLEKEIIVTAKKSDIGKLSTGTVHIIGQNEIETLPVESFLDLMDIIPGIVDKSYIRGSRATDLDFQVDGVSVRDPLFGGLSNGSLINIQAIREIQIHTGGFNAEFGNTMAGVVNMITKSGGKDWSGGIKVKNSLGSLNGRNGKYKLNSRGENIVEFNLSGGIPKLRDRLNIFISGRVDTENNRTPGLNVLDPLGNNITAYQHNELRNKNLFAKVVFKLSNETKITTGGFYSTYDYDNDSWFWKYNSNYLQLPSTSEKNMFFYTRLSSFIRSNILMEAKFEYSEHRLSRGIREDSGDVSWYTPYNIIPEISEESPISYGVDNPYGVSNVFVDAGRLSSYWNTKSNYVGGNINFTGNVKNYLTFKTGINIKKYIASNLYFGDLDEEASLYQDNYREKPYEYRTYGDVSFNLKGVNFNTGMLVHYLNANIIETENSDGKEISNPKLRFNPRVGLAYEYNKSIIAHANYGWYYQVPTFHSLYAETDVYRANSTVSLDGNPTLAPPRTIAYEAGLKFISSEDFSLDITGYYKKLNSLEELSPYSFNSGNFASYTNSGKSEVYGIETIVKKTMSRYLDLNFSYTYSKAKGTLLYIDPPNVKRGSSEVDINQEDIFLKEPLLRNVEYYLPFDKRHNLRSVANFKVPDKMGFEFYGFRPLQNITASFLTIFETGSPYTYQSGTGEVLGEINKLRHPWYTVTNFRLQKEVILPGFNISAFMDVKNLFNRTEARYNHPVTNNPIYSGNSVLNTDPSLSTGSTYNPIADLNNDGVIDSSENTLAYQNFLKDFTNLKLLNQLPREVWFGFKVKF